MNKVAIGMQNILAALYVTPVPVPLEGEGMSFGGFLRVIRLMALIIGISLLLAIIFCKIKKKKVNQKVKICFIISIVIFIGIEIILYPISSY